MNGQQEQIREARFRERIQRADGFTLIELILVLAIVGILVSVAIVSCDHFVTKAKSIEGEIVVHEIERLEYLYHASNHVYTDSLTDLGFAMTGTLKHYTPEVRKGLATDKISYQVRAVPATASATWRRYLPSRPRTSRLAVECQAPSNLSGLGPEAPCGAKSAVVW